MRVRATIAYDGTSFHGWAPQPELRTVGGVLSQALDGAQLTVAGRTDAGVHAHANVVSFDAGRVFGAGELNAKLPDDVAVLETAEAPGFDARGDATARSYVYRISTAAVPDPFRSRYQLHQRRVPDEELLQACADAILGRHYFRAFTPTETQHVFFERTVSEARWERQGERLEFRITADAFLRHMVRVLVGTMLERPEPELFERLVTGRPRSEAGRTAPPHGLALTSVAYAT